MLLNWAIHTSLIQKAFSQLSIKALYVFYNFLELRITKVALVLQLIWYYRTSWVSNIGDLVLVLIFWFRIIKREWFFMLGIIASNLLKITNAWVIVVKYATTVVYVGPHFFPQILEKSRSHSNAWHAQLNGKRIDDSTENIPGTTNSHRNYEKCECRD